MRIDTTIDERTVHRPFRKHLKHKRTFTIFDRGPPNGSRTFFVYATRKLGTENAALGTTEEMTADEAHTKAVAAIAAARTEREADSLFTGFAEDFRRRRAQRWKPANCKANRHAINRYLISFFGTMLAAGIAPADMRRWFDALSATPGNANRTLPVLSVVIH